MTGPEPSDLEKIGIVCCVVGCVLSLIWIWMFARNRKMLDILNQQEPITVKSAAPAHVSWMMDDAGRILERQDDGKWNLIGIPPKLCPACRSPRVGNYCGNCGRHQAERCDVCGTITIRSGTCWKCLNCGNSMGVA